MYDGVSQNTDDWQTKCMQEMSERVGYCEPFEVLPGDENLRVITPALYTPTIRVLFHYGIRKKELVFVRERHVLSLKDSV